MSAVGRRMQESGPGRRGERRTAPGATPLTDSITQRRTRSSPRYAKAGASGSRSGTGADLEAVATRVEGREGLLPLQLEDDEGNRLDAVSMHPDDDNRLALIEQGSVRSRTPAMLKAAGYVDFDERCLTAQSPRTPVSL